MTAHPLTGQDYYAEGQDLGYATINDHQDDACHIGYVVALSKTTTAPPGSPSNGDAYVVPASATGDWLGHDHEVAYYYSGWKFRDLQIGEMFTVIDEGTSGEIVVKQDGTPTYKRVADINGLSAT